jgi:hypothetical protein
VSAGQHEYNPAVPPTLPPHLQVCDAHENIRVAAQCAHVRIVHAPPLGPVVCVPRQCSGRARGWVGGVSREPRVLMWVGTGGRAWQGAQRAASRQRLTTAPCQQRPWGEGGGSFSPELHEQHERPQARIHCSVVAPVQCSAVQGVQGGGRMQRSAGGW